ncbi:MAG TPA: hypothetical protein VL326_38195, partial [Kofleriaceae bacterium]|nr:hypothetical protein [Kofleriaceae bacterium]
RFAPVQAKAVRAFIECSQSSHAYIAELEAWEEVPPPSCDSSSFMTIPNDHGSPMLGEDNSVDHIKTDSDRFWWGEIAGFDDHSYITNDFATLNLPEYWQWGPRDAAMVQLYDLLVQVDLDRARVYLERLHVISNDYYNNRDDIRVLTNVPPTILTVNGHPYDHFHGQVMPAWGAVDEELDNQWTAKPGLDGLLAYPMAAFARRVAEHPGWFCYQYRQDAIKFTNSVIATYKAFRQDMHLTANDPYWYYINPPSYVNLQCTTGDIDRCRSNRAEAGMALPYNLSLSMLKAMADVAIAADSDLYKTSSQATADAVTYGTNEAPRAIAKNVTMWVDKLDHRTLSDGTPWVAWKYSLLASAANEDLNHANFTLGSIVTMWENKSALDGYLARNGYSERVNLDSSTLASIVNGFLRKIWYYDYTPGSPLHDLLTKQVDGNPSPPGLGVSDNGNPFCTAWARLAQFDPWMWRRCRDAIFYSELPAQEGCGTSEAPWTCQYPALDPENHAALLGWRKWLSP